MSIEDSIHQFLIEIGDDPNREGLKNTPSRMIKTLRELTQGYKVSPEEVVEGAIFEVEYDELVLIKDVEYYSLCEHHVIPFFGKCHVGYIPNGRVIGFSKIPRIIEVFSKRLQLQERMTEDIANFILKTIEPQGVAVVVEGFHLCMAMRGVQKQDARMITSAMKGLFRRDPRSRAEFLQLISR
jgi:GTP cyclohydrolase I